MGQMQSYAGVLGRSARPFTGGLVLVLGAGLTLAQDPDRGASGGGGGAPSAVGGAAQVNAIEFTPGTGTCGGDSSQAVGWEFDALVPVRVTAMSWFDTNQDGLAAEHEVALWDPAGNIVPGTNVTIPAGTLATLDGIWRIVEIPPVVLAPGAGYIVGGMNSPANGCLSSNMAHSVHPDIAYFDATYGSGPPLQRPTSHSSATEGFYGPGFQIDGQVGEPFCFGDGSTLVCLCGNFGGEEQGCANSTGRGGVLASVEGSGSASADDLVLEGSNLPPGVTTLFFSGTLNINDGLGEFFGDGIRCAGGQITRLEIVAASPGGLARTSVGIASTAGAAPGATSFLQLWYRDVGGPCSSQFNVTNALEVVWN